MKRLTGHANVIQLFEAVPTAGAVGSRSTSGHFPSASFDQSGAFWVVPQLLLVSDLRHIIAVMSCQ